MSPTRAGLTIGTTTLRWLTVAAVVMPMLGIPVTWFITNAVASAVANEKIVGLQVKQVEQKSQIDAMSTKLQSIAEGVARIEGRLAGER